MPENAAIRRTLVVALTVLGCLLAVLSLVTVWGRNQILDTDRYLVGVAPLASDPAIQRDVSEKIARAINEQLAESKVVENALPEQAKFLAVPISISLEQVVREKTDDFVHSPAFAKLWIGLNRQGHQELVRILNGEQSEAVVISNGRLGLDLGAVVEEVRNRLVSQGLTVVATLPQISVIVDVADARGLESAQVVVHRIDLLAKVLPVLSIGCLLGAVVLAKRRRRTGVLVALGLVWTMVLVRVALAVGQDGAVASVPRRVASRDAVDAYYAHLTVLLHRGDVVIGLVAALVALVLVVVRVRTAEAGGRTGVTLVGPGEGEWGLLVATVAGAALLTLAAPVATWLAWLVALVAAIAAVRMFLVRTPRTPAAS